MNHYELLFTERSRSKNSFKVHEHHHRPRHRVGVRKESEKCFSPWENCSSIFYFLIPSQYLLPVAILKRENGSNTTKAAQHQNIFARLYKLSHCRIFVIVVEIACTIIQGSFSVSEFCWYISPTLSQQYHFAVIFMYCCNINNKIAK